jgi:hypothetical protein
MIVRIHQVRGISGLVPLRKRGGPCEHEHYFIGCKMWQVVEKSMKNADLARVRKTGERIN